ncbi:MAG: ion channel [Myxococcota bacterium]|nr:ion channel [Myxococcota bacterium]
MAARPHRQRLVDNRGKRSLSAIGLSRSFWRDVYHRILEMRWPTFLAFAFGGYVAVHALFAVLYLAQPDSIANSDGSFWSAYFFSVQTMMTIGYGAMTPATAWANAIVLVEAFLGLLATAMLTGLVFAKFSKPKAAVLWSEVACIAMHEGVPTLSIRMANERGNRVVEAGLTLVAAFDTTTKEGERFRRITDLHLVRRSSPLFFVSWTAMHRIDEHSPLFGETQASLAAKTLEIMAVLTGLDETSSQSISARHSYLAADLRFGERFADILDVGPDGERVIDYRRFHDTRPAPLPAPALERAAS